MTDHNKKTNAESIPYEAWPADWFPDAEREAADTLGLTLYELMLRAGEAAFQLAVRCYPQARRWLVICGHGNNGGDGYVAARLAQGQGIDVTLLATESDKPLPDEAEAARVAWLNAGGVIHAADAPWPEERDLIIDGLLGTGLRNAPRAELQLLIEKINLYPAPVLALDIPSGLLAASGAAPGAVVQAQHTLAFIALKCGLLTGKARDVVGHLHCHDLGLSAWLAAKPAPFVRLDASCLARWLTPRRPTAHKGDHAAPGYQKQQGALYQQLLDTPPLAEADNASKHALPIKDPADGGESAQSFGRVLSVIKPDIALVERNGHFAVLALAVADRWLRLAQLQPGDEKLRAQPLLIPVRLKLEATERQTLSHWQDLLETVGMTFAIDAQFVTVRAVPLPLRQQNLQNLIPELIGYLAQQEKETAETIARWLAGRLTCSHTEWGIAQAITTLADLERLCPKLIKNPPPGLLQYIDLQSAISALKHGSTSRECTAPGE